MSSYSMENKQQAVSAGSLCYAAVLTALVFVLTFVPKIPIPLGYAHLGDAIIFASVLFSTRRQAALAASVGSALSDFIGGFPLWIIPTLIIKYVMVEAVFYTVRPDKREWKLTARLLRLFLICCLDGPVLYCIGQSPLRQLGRRHPDGTGTHRGRRRQYDCRLCPGCLSGQG